MTDFRCVFRFTLFIITYLPTTTTTIILLYYDDGMRFIFILYFFLFWTWSLYTFSFQCQLTNYYHTARTPAVQATGHGSRSDAVVYTVPVYNIQRYVPMDITVLAMYLQSIIPIMYTVTTLFR